MSGGLHNSPERYKNGFTRIVHCTHMNDTDPDTEMIAAGVVISLIALLELYPAIKNGIKR
jgi:hypothetical protein